MKPPFQVEFDEHGASYRVRRALRSDGGKGGRRNDEPRTVPTEAMRSGLLLAVLRKGLLSRGRRQGYV